MEPPSPELIRRLAELQLADDRDLHACRRRVRVLARGLPALDSIWIDALVQAKRLTPLQARLLESGAGDTIRANEHLVLTELRQREDIVCVYEARDPESREKRLVTRIHTRITPEMERALSQLIRTGSEHPSAKRRLPVSYAREAEYVDVAFSFCTGKSVSELLVRRGRFPEPVVQEVALKALALLASESAPHGDLRCTNVWLDLQGRVALLNWGILPVIEPVVSVHSRLPAQFFEGIAPERVGSDAAANPATEVYALGCLLWQMLAGRPPFVMADPLDKLRAHERRTIPDIREFAPDVGESFAALLRRMTARDPHRRPQSFDALCTELQTRKTPQSRRVKSFVRSFESAAPRNPHSSRHPNRWRFVTTAVALLGVSSAAFGLMWNRTSWGLPELRNAAAHAVRTVSEGNRATGVIGGSPESPANSEGALPLVLPDPNVKQQIVLLENAEYFASDLQFDHPITIQGGGAAGTRILVTEETFRIVADAVKLENLQIIDRRGVDRSGPSVSLEAQEVRIDRCWIESTGRNVVTESLLQWKSLDSIDPQSGRLLVTHSVLMPSGPAIEMLDPLTTVAFEEVYLTGGAALLTLHHGARAGLQVPIVLNRCTVRSASSLLEMRNPSRLSQTGRLSLQGRNSVVELEPERAVIEINGGAIPSRWEHHFEVAAEGLIVDRQTLLIGQRGAGGKMTELDASGMMVNGLLAGQFHFESDAAHPRGLGRVEIDELAVRFSMQAPGADPAELPNPPLPDRSHESRPAS